MHHRSSLLVIASIILALAGQPAWANLVTNGDFNAVILGPPYTISNPADIPGWTHTGSLGNGLLWAIGYSDPFGNITAGPPGDAQFVTMGGTFDAPADAGWTQTVSDLTIGQRYLLQFYIANEGANELPGGQTMTASVESGVTMASNTYTVAGTGNYWKNWVQEGFIFTAGESSAVLGFSVTNQQYDMGLGEVSLNPVTSIPAPSSLALLAGSLLGLGWLRRRRTHTRTFRLAWR